MKTQKVKLYIHFDRQNIYGNNRIAVFATDMSYHDYPLLGMQEVELTFPDFNPNQLEIKMLEEKAAEMQEEHDAKMYQLNERIKSLKSIEYKPEVA